MKNFIVSVRNKIFHFLYKHVLKHNFFLFDPEDVHDYMTVAGSFLGKYKVLRFFTRLFFNYSDSKLEQNILGIYFSNPIGLAAGFDKDGKLVDILPEVGFGFEEIGSITGEPCKGNPKPRMWRIPSSKGLIVYYGLKNDGSEVVRDRLSNRIFKIPIGISVAMTNCKENMDVSNAIKDYVKAFRAFTGVGHYFTINISCPNAVGGQPFILPNNLDLLMKEIDLISTDKPIFIKLSPDLSMDEIDKLLDVAKRHRIHGIIVANLTKNRNNPLITDKNISSLGGISGKPVQDLSDKIIAYIYKKEGKRFVIVGCGGVFSAEDAYKKIKIGASMVQLITGMIYEGPQLIGEINQGIVKLLSLDGYRNISEAVGTAK